MGFLALGIRQNLEKICHLTQITDSRFSHSATGCLFLFLSRNFMLISVPKLFWQLMEFSYTFQEPYVQPCDLQIVGGWRLFQDIFGAIPWCPAVIQLKAMVFPPKLLIPCCSVDFISMLTLRELMT